VAACYAAGCFRASGCLLYCLAVYVLVELLDDLLVICSMKVNYIFCKFLRLLLCFCKLNVSPLSNLTNDAFSSTDLLGNYKHNLKMSTLVSGTHRLWLKFHRSTFPQAPSFLIWGTNKT
jgi:hypothetical protein